MEHDPKLAEKFWAKVDRRGPDDCWTHKNTPTKDGYIRSYGVRSHRLAYELAKGSIPAGLLVRHTCDNPGCQNPNHLVLGTQLDNMRDMCERGRHAIGKRKLLPWQVRNMRLSNWYFGYSCDYLARVFKVTPGHVRNICRGARWASVEI